MIGSSTVAHRFKRTIATIQLPNALRFILDTFIDVICTQKFSQFGKASFTIPSIVRVPDNESQVHLMLIF